MNSPRRPIAYLTAAALTCAFACTKQAAQDDAAASSSSDAAPQAKVDVKPKPKANPELTPIADVVATVGGEAIPASAFMAQYEPIAQSILDRRDDGVVPTPFQAMQRRKIIAQLIWSKQMELEAKRSGVDYDPEALAQMEAKERAHVLDWDAWLARINQTAAIRRQANVDYLRERALFAARDLSIEPTDEQLRAFHAEHEAKFQAPEKLCRASHLLIAFGPRQADEKIQPVLPADRDAAGEAELAKWEALALARAQALREAVTAPDVDFNEFAREWSEGPGAFRGGDMGLFPFRQMVPEYSEAVFAMKTGDVSEPIKSEKGYYVIKSFGCFEPGQLPYEAVRADLVRTLEAQYYDDAHQKLEAELDERFPAVSPILDEAEALKKPGPRPPM